MLNKGFKMLAAVLACMTLLVGCQSGGGEWGTEEITGYVRSRLDSLYLDKHDEAVEYMELTEEESKQSYLEGLEVEAEYFADNFGIEYLTDEVMADLVELLDEVYAHSNYEVEKAQELDGGSYMVRVTVHPIDVQYQMYDDLDAVTDAFFAQYDDVDVYEMTDEEYDAWYEAQDKAYADEIIKLCREKLKTVGYLEPVEHLVEVFLDEEGYYDVSESYYDIDTDVIAY